MDKCPHIQSKTNTHAHQHLLADNFNSTSIWFQSAMVRMSGSADSHTFGFCLLSASFEYDSPPLGIHVPQLHQRNFHKLISCLTAAILPLPASPCPRLLFSALIALQFGENPVPLYIVQRFLNFVTVLQFLISISSSLYFK